MLELKRNPDARTFSPQPIVRVPLEGDRLSVARNPGRRPRFVAFLRGLVFNAPSGLVEQARRSVAAASSVLERCDRGQEEGENRRPLATLSYSASVSSVQRGALR